jgi:hypothetical protein
MKSKLVRLHNILAWLLVAGCFMQIYLIALFVFRGVNNNDLHWSGGYIVAFTALLSLIVALIIRVSKWNVILSLVVFLQLFPGQAILAYSEISGYFRALHGLNGMLILVFSYLLANGFAKAVLPESASEELETASATATASD